MQFVILGVLIFGGLVWFGLAKRNSKVDKAKEAREDALAAKEANDIDKETKEILDSIDQE